MSVAAETVLRVEGASKLYARRPEATRKRLAKSLLHAFAGLKPGEAPPPRKHEFWALDGVSFSLARGEALGVIGLNGSGKTTLLRILAGQILPDRGQVAIAGTSAAMIDLQAGFQAAAPGLRNIFLRAAALGFTEAEIRARVDEIVAFSELGDAIEAPMATYSSGMKMRLAFSVMAMVAPDVLFIDEVLAVGDFRFRQKCLAKIREMRERSAFVFVSHSMADIVRFCDRAIVLHKGKVYFEGPPEEAIETYESLTDDAPAADAPAHLVRAMGPTFANDAALSEIEHYWCDENGNRVEQIDFATPIRLMVKFRSAIDVRNLVIGVPMWNVNAHYATGLSTEITSDRFDVAAGEQVALMLEAEGGVLNPGTLKSMLTVLDGAEYLYRRQNPDLVIAPTSHPTWGVVTVPHRWRRVDMETETQNPKLESI